MRSIYAEKIIPKMLAVQVLGGAWPGVVWSPLSHVSATDLPEPSSALGLAASSALLAVLYRRRARRA